MYTPIISEVATMSDLRNCTLDDWCDLHEAIRLKSFITNREFKKAEADI